MFSGGQLRFYLENLHPESIDFADIAIVPTMTYILTKDQVVHDQIFALLEAKTRHPQSHTIPGYMVIASPLHSSERATLGLGFPLSQLQEAADAGFEIIARLRNWEPLTEESLEITMTWLGNIPNLAAVGFNDQTVPGDGTDPIVQDRLAQALEGVGKPLVSFEFYEQVGLAGLADRLDNQLLRVHAIAENELRRYTDFDVAMDRYGLAATERNIRYIYLRFQGLINPAAALESSIEMIAGVHNGLISEGLTVGKPQPLPSYSIGRLPMFLMGSGVIAAGGWLFALAAEPFAKRKWYLPYGILVAFGCVLWLGLMFIAPTISRKLMALAGAIVFPSLSVTLALIHKPTQQGKTSSFSRTLNSIQSLLLISVMTFTGSIIMSAMLADPVFMIKMNSFFGVKVSHLIPLVMVPGILWLREENWYGIMSGTAKSSVKFWQLAVGGVLLMGFAIYILRTGNESPDLVSEIEVRIRSMLTNILGVRPRTKEFLIGHPIMMVLFYYGYKLEMFPFVMVGLVGQISIISTYAHLHTPIMISLLRTFNGLWIGIVLGVIAIAAIEWMLRIWRKLDNNYAEAKPKGIKT